MDISVSEQILNILYSFIIGITLGIIYDVFRVIRVFFGMGYSEEASKKLDDYKLPLIGSRTDKIRKLSKNENSEVLIPKRRAVSQFFLSLFVFIEDILYFVIITPVFLIFIYHANHGEIRWFLIIGAILGFVIYYLTVGHVTMLCSEFIVFSVRSLWTYLIFFTVRPIIFVMKFIFKKISSAVIYVKNKIIFKINLKKMKKYTENCYKQMSNIVKIYNIEK